jgi:trans-aconitate 2-methyltransferase
MMSLRSALNRGESLYPIHSKYVPLYQERSQPQFRWSVAFLQRLDFKGVARIVNWGCRDGQVSMEIARHYPSAHVIGVDSAIQLMEAANETLAKRVIPNLEFRFWDLLSMDFHGAVDAIFSSDYLHWIDDKQALLQAMGRSLKPGGRLALSFLAAPGHVRFDTLLADVMQLEKWRPYFIDYCCPIRAVTAAHFAALLEESGLQLKRMEYVPIHDIFETPLDFAEWLTCCTPQLRALPEELHEAFLSDVTQQHLERFPLDKRGHLHRYDTLLEVEAYR